MQQLACIEPGNVGWLPINEPTLLSPVEALVRPLAVARCDIDLFLASGLIPASAPFALGHECVAEIVALGDAVVHLSVGQKVVVAFQVSCGACSTCRFGHTANCEQYPVLSDYGMQPLSGVEYGGMLTDLVRIPHAAAMLQPISEGLDPVALGSVSDNVLDGYRAGAPHLAEAPGSEVLVVCHGLKSIPLYAVQAAVALGAARVDFASDDHEALRMAESLGARPVLTDFAKRQGRYPVVVDAGVSEAGLHYAIASTRPEGVCHSVSFYAGGNVPLPLGRMYTLGIRFFIGRAHSAALLPQVLPLIESGRLRPQDVTTRVVSWKDAAQAWLKPATKLVIRRD
ncbi:MAG: zinc-binding dehydrogenase [Candidatus Binatia bacterium]